MRFPSRDTRLASRFSIERRVPRAAIALAATLALLVTGRSPADDGGVTKRVVRIESGGTNLLQADAWQPWQQGFVSGGCHVAV